MSRRPPPMPPLLPGYEYERLLGSGRFSDVFLYRQARPHRRVAVKVLLSSVLEDSAAQPLVSDATALAQLSTHPSIVTIHQAEVSEERCPHFVMEYCARPHYGLRFRAERITVAEALSVGVQIAGAVESGHRSGILHRDITPANILVTDDRRPVLSDFGISIATSPGREAEGSGSVSILWSPPEFFTGVPRVDARSDVFSLASTVYSLLAGRTPFEHPGGRNSAADLIHRVATEPLAPLTRPDVPDELQRALSRAMAKDPAGRYDTALAFGRSLQRVELALSLPVTQMEVLDDRASGDAGTQDDELSRHTRIREVAAVDPTPGLSRERDGSRLDPYAGVAAALGPSAPSAAGSVASAPTRTELSTRADGVATALRPAARDASSASADRVEAYAHRQLPAAPTYPAARTPPWPFVALAAVLVVVLGVGTALVVRHITRPEPEQRATVAVNDPAKAQDPPDAPRSVAVAALPALEGSGDTDRATISWDAPENVGEGDYYQVRWKDLPADYSEHSGWVTVKGRVSTTRSTPPGVSNPCLEVRTVSPGGSRSVAVSTCLGEG